MMAPWRTLGVSVLALGSVVGVGAVVVSGWVVLPPLLAATIVLAAAAQSVDYFGLRRRSKGKNRQASTYSQTRAHHSPSITRRGLGRHWAM